MKIQELVLQTKKQNWQEKLKFIASLPLRSAFSTSFSIEDQVITNFIAVNNLPIEIFTIDTGRLPEETLKVWQDTTKKYQIKITSYYPDHSELEKFVGENGVNPFYQSKELRLSCCKIRKIEPLKRALNNRPIAKRFHKFFQSLNYS